MNTIHLKAEKHKAYKGVIALFLLWISSSHLGLSRAAFIRSNESSSSSSTLVPHEEDDVQDSYTRYLQTDTNDNEATKEFMVTWQISLGGQESLIQSSFYLKAGLEQAIKNYINRDLECDPDADTKKTTFHSVSITNTESEFGKNLLRITGSAKCNGNKEKCRYKMKKVITDADEIFLINDDDDIDDDNEAPQDGNS